MLHPLRRVALLTCLAPLTLLACSSDDASDDPPGAGGQGGASAGQGGAGGSAAGKGGGAGAAGAGTAGASAGAAGTGAGTAGGGGAGMSGASGQGGGFPAGGTAGQGGAAGAGAGGAGSGGAGAGGASGGAGTAGGSGGASGSAGAGGSCKAPDVLLLLDRTLTMHFTPTGVEPTDKDAGYKTSKWAQAIAGIEQMVSPPTDATIRFGLELWPRENPTCVTLAERVEGKLPENPPLCEAGEIKVPLGANQGGAIQAALDASTTRICSTTPTGTALLTAKEYLQQNAEEGREQYVVLVTDGADWDKSCPEPAPLPVVQELAAAGIKTFVVGFSAEQTTQSGVGKEFLNDMACAGQTAKGFPGTCKMEGGGYVAIDAGGAAPLFLSASDGGQLAKSLQGISGELCCDCEKSCEPPDMLFALDRTLTMHFTPAGMTPTDGPDYKSSKWSQAIAGIEKVVASPNDQYFRFGLELWPKDSPGCITLAQRVGGMTATNAQCEAGEIAVGTDVAQGAAIQSYLDPTTTHICLTTPTGTALTTASTYLTTNSAPGREQYVVLVTDGADWDKSCPEPNPLLVTQQLAASGIKTFVVGFSTDLATESGVGKTFLNDMACAGQTALGFPASCKLVDGGYVAVKPDGPRLYLAADNSEQLSATLQKATENLGCKP